MINSRSSIAIRVRAFKKANGNICIKDEVKQTSVTKPHKKSFIDADVSKSINRAAENIARLITGKVSSSTSKKLPGTYQRK